MQDIIINKTRDDISVYVLEDRQLVEMYCYKPEVESTLGNIYIGKVMDIVNGMQAAFVDIGIGKNAFISVKDAMKKVDVVKEKIEENQKMSDVLKTGQMLLVQVKKEPIDEKGARVSTHITFPGKYIVLMPGTSIVTISQKIELESEKQRLFTIVKENLPNGFGAIIRTDACNIKDAEIVKDVESVISQWETIEKKSCEANTVELLYNDHDIVDRTMRDIVSQKTQKIYVNDKAIFDKIIDTVGTNMCELDEKSDMIEKFDLTSEVEKAHNRKIYLKCGGHIVIDKTEALTAIDVNSGKYTGSKDLETTTLKVNMEAANEIMKQIRLKDVGGIIVIDFIDMHSEEHKNMILDTMRREAKKDRSKVDVKHFTELNLVELTRKKMYV